MLSLFWFYPTQAETASTGDYGICAHLQRWEYPVYRQELDIIKELGIGFVRFDFDWAMIEPRRGEFHGTAKRCGSPADSVWLVRQSSNFRTI